MIDELKDIKEELENTTANYMEVYKRIYIYIRNVDMLKYKEININYKQKI